MSEVEKMYKNAKVKLVCDGLDCFTCTAKCNNGKYPEFTAEKQLELLKWLCEHRYRNYIIFEYFYKIDSWRMECNLKEVKVKGSFEECFKECVAYLLNDLWQDLTESEQEQIRSILNG